METRFSSISTSDRGTTGVDCEGAQSAHDRRPPTPALAFARGAYKAMPSVLNSSIQITRIRGYGETYAVMMPPFFYELRIMILRFVKPV